MTERFEDVRAIAEGLVGDGRPSEFLIYMNVLVGLVLRTLYGIAPRVPWYDLGACGRDCHRRVHAAGRAAAARRIAPPDDPLRAARTDRLRQGLSKIYNFRRPQSCLPAAPRRCSPPWRFVRLLRRNACRWLCVPAAALAFFWGSLFRFEAAFLAAALVAPMLLLWTRQNIAALPMSLLWASPPASSSPSRAKPSTSPTIASRPAGRISRTKSAQRLRVSEYLHADLSRQAEFNAALAAVEWSRNDYDLITNWMLAVPDT